MKIFTYKDGGWAANCHLILDEASGTAAVFDPSAAVEKVQAKLAAERATLRYIVLTHGHFDHMLRLDEFRSTFPSAPLCIHEADAENLLDADKSYYTFFAGENKTFMPAEVLLHDGDTLYLGSMALYFLHTPGHTRGSVCCVCERVIVTGDTLFDGDIGRCDLYGGDLTQVKSSLQKLARLAENGKDYKLYPGHGGTSRLLREMDTNPYMTQENG